MRLYVLNWCFFLHKVDNTGSYAEIHVPTTAEEAQLDLTTLNTVGVHNAQNAGTAALLVLGLDIGLNQKIVQNAIPFLEPLPHRMEKGNGLISLRA
jgi:UDP-N-acetylmuramyl pentapeptide synthase